MVKKSNVEFDVCICEPFVLPGVLPTLAMPTLKTALSEKGISSKIFHTSLSFFMENGLHSDPDVLNAIDNVPLQFSEFLFSSDESEGVFDYVVSALGVSDANLCALLVDKLKSLRLKAKQLVANITQSIADANPHVLCHSLTFGDYNFAFSLFSELKKRLPQVKIIVGGSNCTPAFSEVLMQSSEFIDFVVCDEDFASTLELIDSILAKDVPKTLESVTTQTIIAKRLHKVTQLDNLPCPDFSDFITAAEAHGMKRDKLIVTYEVSRGCWWGEQHPCSMCGYFGHQKCFLIKSPQKVAKELRNISCSQGIKFFRFTDLVQPKHDYLIQLMQEGLPQDIKLFWELRPNLSTSEVSSLRSLGTFYVQIGLESLSTSQLDYINKGTTAIENIFALIILGTYRVHAVWNYLYGFAEDKAEWYDSAIAIMPKLFHLQPPDARKVWINKSSAIFESVSYDNLVPIGGGKSKNGLGKEFDVFFETDINQKLIPTYEALNREIKAWKQAFEAGYEFYVETVEIGRVHLVRYYGSREDIFLEGLDAAVFYYCFDPRTLEEISQELDIDLSSITEALTRMTDSGWMVFLDNHFLSLATRNTHYKWQRFNAFPKYASDKEI